MHSLHQLLSFKGHVIQKDRPPLPTICHCHGSLNDTSSGIRIGCHGLQPQDPHAANLRASYPHRRHIRYLIRAGHHFT